MRLACFNAINLIIYYFLERFERQEMNGGGGIYQQQEYYHQHIRTNEHFILRTCEGLNDTGYILSIFVYGQGKKMVKD